MRRTEHRLYHLLQLAAGHLRRRADRELEPHGLTATQLGALFVVGRSSCRLKDLSRALHVNASAVTTLARRLEAAGLVESQRSTEDARATELILTPAGEEAVQVARPRVAALNDALIEGFTDDEVEVIARFLHACIPVRSGDDDDR